jgi:hypothetical protein
MMSPKPAPAPTLLLHGVRVADVVARCRVAALAFTNGAGAWEKAQLAHWLIGPYRDATHMGSNAPPPMFTARPRGHVEPAGVDELLADAHVRVVSVLENAAISRDKTAFAKKIAAEHAMHPIIDVDAHTGWMPIDTPRMRLAYRVLTLFAADALSRPAEYENLTVCHRCERVRFKHLEAKCACETGENRRERRSEHPER